MATGDGEPTGFELSHDPVKLDGPRLVFGKIKGYLRAIGANVK